MVVEKEGKKVKEALIRQLTNCGFPYLEDDNYREGLYLRHYHDGRDLDPKPLEGTLELLHFLWGGPVYLETVRGGKRAIFFCEGKRVSTL